jgi:ABC-type multidrug transport system fused ATPase/permease subunit
MTFVAKTAAYLSMGLLFVVVLLGVFTWLSIGSGKAVTFAEVQRSLELKRDPLIGIQAAVPDIQLPGLIQKYVGDDYREEFVGWMNGLQKHQQVDFINNLETIISQARSLDPQHVEDFIVEYQKLKSHRTAIGPFAGYLLKFSLMVVLLVVVCLLVLLSLVLFEARGKKSARPAKAGAARRPRPKGKPSLVKSTSAK